MIENSKALMIKELKNGNKEKEEYYNL